MLDVKPRTMAAGQLNVLINLAELVVRQLEKDHILKLQKLVSWPDPGLSGMSRPSPQDLAHQRHRDVGTCWRLLEKDHILKLQKRGSGLGLP